MRVLMAFFALLLALYPSMAGADTPTPPPDWTAAMRAQTLNGTEDALSRYFFVNRIPKIKAAIEANRAALLSIADPDTFATAVTKVLYDASHDKHLAVSYSSDPVPQPKQQGKPSPKALAYRQRMNAAWDYGFLSCARLMGNIGYLRLMFFGPLKDEKAMYDSAMTLLSNTDGLVIDLRGNEGGAAASVDYLLGYFFPKSVDVTGFQDRNGPTVTHRKMYTPAVLGAPRFIDKPVYVLINQYTFSGGEQFAYDLKALHRATLIGETTGGGANPGGEVWLNDHFSVFIPRGTAVNPYTGTNWEGTGVAPDIALDPQNGKAFIEAYTLALKSAKNSFPAAVDDRNFALRDPAKALSLPFPIVRPKQ